jgi:hypothetical protein
VTFNVGPLPVRSACSFQRLKSTYVIELQLINMGVNGCAMRAPIFVISAYRGARFIAATDFNFRER